MMNEDTLEDYAGIPRRRVKGEYKPYLDVEELIELGYYQRDE